MDGVDWAQSTAEGVSERSWTVGRLNREIQRALEDADDRFPTHVVGEVAEVNGYGFGTFFQLRDLEDEPAIDCLAWAADRSTFGYDITEGTEAVVAAEVDFYPERGDCQLLVSDYWPLGESSRQQELDRRRERLAAEGLFEASRKQPIPPHPDCLGLVTSPAGSAREDVWATVSERSPRTDVRLCGATVQGEDAVPSLVEAIGRLDEEPAVDTLILTRGGGSDTALWSFNAEPLVRRVAACSTPVVVAIGHEDDETMVERAADARAMTPTEAGVMATTPVEEVLEGLAALERRVTHGYRTHVTSRLDTLDRRVESAHEALHRRVTERDAVLDRAGDLDRRITLAYDGLVGGRLAAFERRTERGYRALAATRLDALETRLDAAMTDLELAAESEAATARGAHSRLDDIEARIDLAFRTHAARDLDDLEHRIEAAFREVETDARVAAGEAAARRLRVVVVALAALLVVLVGAVALLLL